MSDPFEQFNPEPSSDSRQRESADLPAALADVQQRLRQLRPRQPQLDLAMLEQLATASHSSPRRAAAGYSKMQLALAIAAAWLCGVFFGAALLLGIDYRSLNAPAQDQLAASDAHDMAHAALEHPAPGNQAADDGALADAETPVISAADALAARERQLPVAADPQRSNAVLTIAGGVPRGLAGFSELDWERPLRANSLRMQPSQQVFIRASRRASDTFNASTPADQPPANTDPATAASIPDQAPDIGAFQPSVPKTRQQWLDDLLAVPPTDVL